MLRSLLERYYESDSRPDAAEDQTGNLVELVLCLSMPGSFRDEFKRQSVAHNGSSTVEGCDTVGAVGELIPQGAAQ